MDPQTPTPTYLSPHFPHLHLSFGLVPPAPHELLVALPFNAGLLDDAGHRS
jgi:hypothetical protein